MEKPIKLCLVDDHPIMVDGIKEIFSNKLDYLVIAEAYSGKQLMMQLQQITPDVIVLDVNMPPGMNGIECTKLIKKQYPTIKIIILTMYDDRLFVNQLIAAGADGCLLKSRGSKELILAIDRVITGKSYFDTVTDFKKIQAKTEEINLSDREIQIVKLVTEGFSSYEIAEKLSIAENTVKTHRKNIFRKLGINHTSQLTRFAIKHGLI